jgi:GGDEF domain-containing protein
VTLQWVVLLEAVGPEQAGPSGQERGTGPAHPFIERLLEQLSDCGPRALHATGRYALQLLVAAEDGLEAHSSALQRWRVAVAAIGAPEWSAVRVEVLTLEEFERECAATGFDHELAPRPARPSLTNDADQLLRSVFEDPVTRLPTAEMFRAQVDAVLRPAQAPGTHHALVMLQIRHGPATASPRPRALEDAVVFEAVRRLGRIVRRDDIVARLRTDTFAVLAKNLGATAATALGRRALAAVSDGRTTGDEGRVEGSVGVAVSETGWGADRLLAAAARAMAAAGDAPERWQPFTTDRPGPAQLSPESFQAESRTDD